MKCRASVRSIVSVIKDGERRCPGVNSNSYFKYKGHRRDSQGQQEADKKMLLTQLSVLLRKVASVV